LHELEITLLRHLPDTFLQAALQSVFAARRMAWDDCRSEFASEEAQNVRPFYARGKLEGLLRDSAERVSGARVRVVSSEGFWNHTEISAGPVVLTAASVQTPCGLVDKSEYRMTLANSGQQELFPSGAPEATQLYCLLLHSSSRWLTSQETARFGHLPGSAFIAFPASDCDRYVHQINLFERFPKVVEAHMPQDWDQRLRLQYLHGAKKRAAG